MHHLAGLAASPIRFILATVYGHCNDCGKEVHPGDKALLAVTLRLPFCVGCAIARDLPARAEPSRAWRQHFPTPVWPEPPEQPEPTTLF